VKVLLVDVDSKIPNLALMKISKWHKLKGDDVGFCIENPDKVYISCIFKKNAEQAKGIPMFYPDAEIDIGGSGINLKKELPEYIEYLKPDYDLYPSTYSQGYTTRGCIRKCEFCIVPEKEGKIHTIQHPSTFHDEKFDTCMIMDNNLFAAPNNWQEQIFNWFSYSKIKMLSPQGWDIRLLNEPRANYLKQIKHAGMIHFAWDNHKDEPAVIKGIEILKNLHFDLHHKVSIYVLCGFNTSFDEDLYRCETLKSLGVQSFVMPYRKTKEISALARWANRPWLYWSINFKDYKKKGAN
jgi:hypothetical protein